MSLLHFLTSRRLGLLAADALTSRERERALAHVAGCPRCAAELRSLRGLLSELGQDPVRSAEPQVPLALLIEETRARIDRSRATPLESRPVRLVWAPALAAALAILALVPRLIDRPLPGGQPAASASPTEPAATGRVGIDAETLRLLERRVAREQAARYLSDAEAVLVTVAAAPQLCDRNRRTLDLAEETRRSRVLLQRALLLDFESAGVSTARPVLEDVDRVLREVAMLEPCTRPEQLLAIHDQLRQGRLLMKIDLMTRELQG